MRKYGIENFIVEEIDRVDENLLNAKELLNEKEKYWISFYDSTSNLGYNILIGGEDNRMDSPLARKHHKEKMQTKEVRDKISIGLKKYIEQNGFSNEHKNNIKTARMNRKKILDEKGLNFYGYKKRNKLELGSAQNYNTRGVKVYCILNTGEKFYFNSIREAGIWWYKNYNPFNSDYSECTFQRKIKMSISGKEIYFKNKLIDNITWFKGDD